MLFFVSGLHGTRAVLDFFAAEGDTVAGPDLQELNQRIEALTVKVEALRRFL